MAINWGRIDWHDIQIAEDDLPEPGEEVLVTVAGIDGNLRTKADIYLKELDNGEACWCQKVYIRERKCFDEAIVWEPVIAWAYYPAPYVKKY